MRRRALVCVASAAMLVAVGAAVAMLRSSPSSAAERISLKVLYVGTPGSQRQKDFCDFLQKHFQSVASADIASFTPEQADPWHVILMDPDAEGSPAPHKPLPDSYTRPTLLFGTGGLAVARERGLKAGFA